MPNVTIFDFLVGKLHSTQQFNKLQQIHNGPNYQQPRTSTYHWEYSYEFGLQKSHSLPICQQKFWRNFGQSNFLAQKLHKIEIGEKLPVLIWDKKEVLAKKIQISKDTEYYSLVWSYVKKSIDKISRALDIDDEIKYYFRYLLI